MEDKSQLFKDDIIFSSTSLSNNLSSAELQKYINNAIFLIAEHQKFYPDEVVSLTEQRIDVVVKSSFVDRGLPELLSPASATVKSDTVSNEPDIKAPKVIPLTKDQQNDSMTGTKTYVTENATGQTVNHVR